MQSEQSLLSARPLSEAIGRYMVPWLELDWPIAWGSTFGRSGPLVVEIGFGNGGFLIGQAGQHPASNFVGIERSWGSMQRIFKRLDQAALTNMRLVQGNAAFVLERLFAPDDIDQVFIHFSDPWPKERHHSRRLIQPGFVRLLAQRLAPGSEVTIATDHADYAAWIGKVLEGQPLLRSCFPATSVHDLPGRTPTRYERKAMAAGVPIHYFVWRREACLRRGVAIEKVGPMPNVILKGAYDRTRLLDAFASQTWQETHRGVRVVVKLVEGYRNSQGEHRLIEVMVKEGELTQHFGVLVLPHSDGGVLVKLSPMGRPRPTRGVKQAVWRVAQVVLDQHPQMRVVSSTVGGKMALSMAGRGAEE